MLEVGTHFDHATLRITFQFDSGELYLGIVYILVGSVGSSGGDPRVGSCNWEAPVAPTGAAWCESLKDESKHGYCRCDDRRKYFKQYPRAGSFSALLPQLTMLDNGMLNPRPFHHESMPNYMTYVTHRRTFKLTTQSAAVFGLSGFKVDEASCESKGLARLEGTMLTIQTGEQRSFNPVSDKLPLAANMDYAFVVDVKNEGLCSRFHYQYDIEVR